MQNNGSNLIQIKKGFQYAVIKKIYPKGNVMGATEFFSARDVQSNRIVGIKRIKCEPQKYNLYKGEIAILMGLEPYVSDIPTIYYHDYTDRILTIVMQYFEGDTLFERMEKEKSRIQEQGTVVKNLKRLLSLASILGDVHRRKRQHKDLKPQNIILQDLGNREKLRLIDFGLSAAAVVRGTGTPGYQAPEQCEMYRGVADDSRVDVFIFGLIMYELFCGKKLELGRHLIPDASGIKWQSIPEIDNPSVPKAANDILKKCLAFCPKDRFSNGGEIECQIRKIIPRR